MTLFTKPTCLNDCVLTPKTRTTLEEILTGVRPFAKYGKTGLILYGVFGSGKTTLANILPGLIEATKSTNELETTHIGDVHTKNPYFIRHSCDARASIMNSIQNRIENGIGSFNPSNLNYYILDEVDNLTAPALASLKGAMNSPYSVFIMTTNNLNKLGAGILDRSYQLQMDQVPDNIWLQYIRQVCTQNGICSVNDQQLLPLIKSGQGSCRTILSNVETFINKRQAIAPITKPASNGGFFVNNNVTVV
jgi:replication-associated recombination protein RarA